MFQKDFRPEKRERLSPALGDSQLIEQRGRRGDMKEGHKMMEGSERPGWESLTSLFSSYLEKKPNPTHPTQLKGK